jgi:uncharacterized membrane protein
VAVGVGLAAFAAAMAVTSWQVAALLGWDAMALVAVVWVLAVVMGKSGQETAAMAKREDDSRAAADVLLVSACVASLLGVGAGLLKAAQQHGLAKAGTTGVAVLSVALAWAAVHTVFTLHYASIYFTEGRGIQFDEGDGVLAEGDEPPDYHDFLYVAFTIGMTYQVSDTDLLTKPMRRLALRHALLSYLFGTVVVAMMINVIAGLLR